MNPTKVSRVVVITGATGGLGGALAEVFRAAGDTVLNLSRSCDPLTEGNYVCDVTDEARVREVTALIGRRYGRIDLLIANAGFGIGGAMELLPAEQARRNMDVNFFGALYCAQAALPYMKRGAKILGISSAGSLFPLPFRGMYCASKAALNMLMWSMDMEIRASGVRAVNICPGDVRTTFSAHRVKETETNFRYGERVKRSLHKVEAHPEKRMDAKRVARRIAAIAAKKNPKPQYIIGAKYKLFAFFQRLLPTRLYHSLIRKVYGGN